MMVRKLYDLRDLSRWAICGAVALAAHGGAAAMFVNFGEAMPPGEPTSAIMIDLAPIAAAPTLEQTDLPIAPQQEQSEPQPEEKPVEKVEKEPEKVEEPPPPPQKTEVTLPEPDKPKPEPKPKPKKQASLAAAPEAAKRLAPQAAAPGVGQANPNAMPTWKGLISAHLQRHKSYPSGARSRHEEGTVLLRFVLDRAGHVLSAGIAQGSGHSELDQETLAVVRRAQPFPAPPSDLAGHQFPFTVPMRYYLR